MSALWSKAVEAAAAARLLLDAGHYDGATNRAYYAMFDAARAYLRAVHGIKSGAVKRHATLIEKFSLLAVASGEIDRTHGRALSRAFDDRIIADYSDRSVSEAEARALLENMDAFLAAIEPHLRNEPQ